MKDQGNKVDRRAVGQDVRGAATSACKVNKIVGFDIEASIAWYENGQPVKWRTVINTVDRAHREWRHRMAMAGCKVMDGAEYVEANIQEQRTRRMAA